MKKKLAAALAGVLVVSTLLSGCSSNEISNDNITLKGYKGIEVPQVAEAEKVTSEQVEERINTVLEQNAEIKDVTDRAVETGDTVDINFVGKQDGVEFEGGSAENQMLEIGSNSFIPGFEESIVGHNIGETFDWSGIFPEDYTGNPDLAGKTVVFTITVNAITQSNVPELTNKFVKSVSKKSETVKEYKAETKKTLEKEVEEQYQLSLQDVVWSAVMEATEVKKYPEKKLKEAKKSLEKQYKQAAEYYQQDYETFLKEQMGVTVEEFEKQIKTAAETGIKQQLIAEAIGKKEKLTPSDKEYKAKLKELAEMYGYEDAKALKEVAKEEELQLIVLQDVVKEWLAKNCVQVVDDEE